MSDGPFSKLDERIVIDYEIETISDLHIGGHGTTTPAEVDMPVIKNSEGFPFIPGSSLKGVMRSEMERLLRGYGLSACIGGDTREMCKNGNECTVCHLFGGLDLAASIRIRDATTNTRRTSVRDGVRIDRRTKKAASGAKYDIEVVPKGTIFEGRVTIENPALGDFRYAKLGALLGTIKFFNNTSRAIGGATSRGFGEVRIKPKRIISISPEDYFRGTEGTEFDLSNEDAYIKDWLDYARSKKV